MRPHVRRGVQHDRGQSMTSIDQTTLRRYVLGAESDETSAAIEQEYFARADALDRLKAIEDDLIDDYVSGRLSSDEMVPFERHYLSAPHHRVRVAVARSIRAEAARSSPSIVPPRLTWKVLTSMATWSPMAQFGFSAAAIVLIAVAAWLVRSSRPPTPVVATAPTTQPAPAPPTRAEAPNTTDGQPREQPGTTAPPRLVALILSPINVRSAGRASSLSIPAGTDIVVLHLQGEGNDRNIGGPAVVRTVAGREIWRGTAASEDRLPASARVDVPADKLRVDDYVIELFGTDRDGRETERFRYFFGVRGQVR